MWFFLIIWRFSAFLLILPAFSTLLTEFYNTLGIIVYITKSLYLKSDNSVLS